MLEDALRRLNADYDAFLYGSSTKPPIQGRKAVEEMFRRLNALDSLPAAERYRFTTLQGRYAILIERWDRLQGEKESGRRPGLYGHFGEGGTARSASAGANVGRPGSVQGERGAASADPVRQDTERELFERYVAAKKSRGEDVSGYRLEGFLEGLERERRKVRERLGEGDIVFDVAERDGRVRLVAKKKPKGNP